MRRAPLHHLFLFTAILLTGCPRPDSQTYDLDPDFVAYCFFTQGSYWIYEQDSATGILDSVYVSHSNHGYKPGEASQPGDMEYETYSYIYTLRESEWFVTIDFFLRKEPYLFTMWEMDNQYKQNSAFHLFKYQTGGDTLLDGHPGTYISKRHPKITIHGITYSDAITITHPTPYYGNPTRELTFVKHVGIVRRTFWDGTTWSLLRYHIP